jgi:hypothetical protein
MNQSILLNDDLRYNDKQLCWHCSGLIAGEKINIVINSDITIEQLTQQIRFDWEFAIESWLEDNEPTDENQITLTLYTQAT